MISKFHYLTQDTTAFTHEELVAMAIQANLNWIQLRIKNKSKTETLSIATKAKQHTNNKCTLIINDFVDIAKTIDADGVHLGKSDLSILEARKILGPDKIIGATANTLEDIIELVKLPINYIGLGPFRFTNTKSNLSPILGLNAYQTIMQELNHLKINIPIIAIGGIVLEDIKAILETNLHGIAISSAINLSENPLQMIRVFKEQIDIESDKLSLQ